MSSIRKRLQQWDWRQWTLMVCAFVYLLYIVLSYLYLPGKLKEVVQTDVAQVLGRDIQVKEFFFNPFTLSLTVDQFSVADRPELPLVAWNRLFVNFDAWGSLFGWKIRFSKVQLDMPRIAIQRRKHDFNFSSILTRLSSNSDKSSPSASEAKSALALQIDDIQVLDGLFAYDDISGVKPAHSSIDDITVGVKNLYLATGDDKLNPLNLQAIMPSGGQVNLTGNYRADPLKAIVTINASDIHLEALKDFLANEVPLQLNNGRLTLQATVDLELEKTFQVLVQNGQLGVTDLVLDDSSQDPPLLRGKQLQVQGINMNLVQRRFRIENISLEGFNTNQWIDKEGKLRIQPLLVGDHKADPTTATNAKKVNNEETKPWDFSIGKLSLQNTEANFSDRRDGLNATQKVGGLNATLSDIRLAKDAQAHLQLNAKLNDTGDLNVDGQIVPTPFSLELHYQLEGLALSPFNPYVEQLSWLHIQQASLNANGTVQMQSADPLPLTLNLDADVANLKVQDSRSGIKVLQWKGLQLGQLNLDLARRTLAINKVMLTAPDIALQVDTKKQMNLATLMKPAKEPNAKSTAQDSEKPKTKGMETMTKESKGLASSTTSSTKNSAAKQAWKISVNQIRVQKGNTRFRDVSIKPAFKVGLNAINIKLDKFTSAGDKPANFTLTSKVDKYAPFTVKGTLAPLQQQPGISFTSKLRGLEMPALSPYSGTYIGNNLKSGQLTLDLKYEIKKHKLKGKNNILAKKLYLGDKVESKQAVHLPVALGLALLRDASGVIDLNLDVSGDLNDPKFSVAGIVWKALVNVIVKAATSPFKLLASLVGSSEDLGSITFYAGDSGLNPDSQKKLQQLVKALFQRPQLVVTVHGSADAADDIPALQQQRVLDQIAALRKIPAKDLQQVSLLREKANLNALEKLNNKLKLPGVTQREQALIKANPKLQKDVLNIQVHEQMLADVTKKQFVSQQELLNLADQRALTIKQYLVASAKLDYSRVKLEKSRGENLKSLVCKLGVEP